MSRIQSSCSIVLTAIAFCLLLIGSLTILGIYYGIHPTDTENINDNTSISNSLYLNSTPTISTTPTSNPSIISIHPKQELYTDVLKNTPTPTAEPIEPDMIFSDLISSEFESLPDSIERSEPTVDSIEPFESTADSIEPLFESTADSFDSFDSTSEISEHFEGMFRDLMVLVFSSTMPGVGTPAPSIEPTFNGFITTTEGPSLPPVRMPTDSGDITTTNYPSVSPTAKPVIIGPSEPTTFPTVSPTAKPVIIGPSEPTTSPTVSPTALDIFGSYSYNDVNKPLLFVAVAFVCIGFIISIILLLIYRKKLQEDSSRGTIMETVKEMSWTEKIFCLFNNVFDVISDFMFAIDLLLHYENKTIYLFGWICFIAGIFGVILFYVKLLLMRKVLYRIAKLRKERNNLCLSNKSNPDDPEIKAKTQEIRDRKNLIIFIDLLTVSLEDVPQVTISLLMSLYSGFENEFALISLAFSLFAIFWCPVAILVSCCGLNDDPMPDVDEHNERESQQKTEAGNVTEIQHIISNNNNNNNSLPNGWRALYTNEGRIYYQNDLTQATQWEKPMDDETAALNPSQNANIQNITVRHDFEI